MLRNWINIFIYQIKNSKLFTALNILGLSIGISGLIFALLYWNDEQNYNSWNPEKDKVYQVLVQLSGMTSWSECALFLKPALDADPNIETAMYGEDWYQKDKIVYKGKKEFVDKIINVQRNFFSFFRIHFNELSHITPCKDFMPFCVDFHLSIVCSKLFVTCQTKACNFISVFKRCNLS